VKELNIDLMNKMGWITYSLSRGVGLPHLFVDDKMVKFFIRDEKDLYVIKETNPDQYLFIKVFNADNPIPKMEKWKFNDNQSMFSLIKENLACNKKYKRILKLNSLDETRS
jgi:hypothetical protein